LEMTDWLTYDELMNSVNQGTQNADVLDYMIQNDGITSREAYKNLGVTRLSARIADLKKAGFEIEVTRISTLNRRKKKVFCNVYRLAEYKEGGDAE